MQGLSAAEAARRLREHGPNELRREQATAAWRVLLRQLKGPLIALLAVAAAISLAIGQGVEAAAILLILVANAGIGFLHERRAERALLALSDLTAPRARVLRDGHATIVPAAAVVPGDLLMLEAGDVVAADARLVEAHALTVNEATLTGESLPSEKTTAPSAAGAPLAERHDRVFLGTSVAAGAGLAEVEATGMATQMGRIAHLLSTAEPGPTPLQRHLARVGRSLARACAALVLALFVAGLLQGLPLADVLLSALALAVAAVPEGLPAIVTIALALGVQRMAQRHVLVRRLPTVETLGSTTVICTDKTGTLTTGVMALRDTWGADRLRLLDAAAACCDAELDRSEREGVGDPTEVALLAAAAQVGILREDIERSRPRVATRPFDASRRRMSVLRADGRLHVKGAVESVLPLCAGGAEDRAAAEAAEAEMAARGLRVLAVAVGSGPEEQDLELVGLVGLADPPRTEAVEAVRAAREAGIHIVMVTGDHGGTARAIAREMGILRPGDDEAEVVHARATPEDKLSLVRLWKKRGAVVAMTGDGVNDAPALREAHVGIAMGRTGTEVTRRASDLILADDNFASIVAGIREGRAIAENIRKTLVYLLAGNVGELALMAAAAMAGMPLPLLPLQLLWINLVTDGLPALALVAEPPEPDLLARPPRRPDDPMLGRDEWAAILLGGLLNAGVALGAYAWALRHRDLADARNLAFATLVFIEVLRALAARSRTRTFWQAGPLGNVRLLAVVAVTVAVQLALHAFPASEHLLGIGPLTAADCVLALLLALIPVSLLEMLKFARARAGRLALKRAMR